MLHDAIIDQLVPVVSYIACTAGAIDLALMITLPVSIVKPNDNRVYIGELGQPISIVIFYYLYFARWQHTNNKTTKSQRICYSESTGIGNQELNIQHF